MTRLFLALAIALTVSGQTDPRERRLQERIVASCCWNESIAFHRSETAAQMRAELRQLMDQGLTDQQILERFKAKYTSRVLIEPEGGASVLIYTVPTIAVLLAAIGVAFLIRNWLRARNSVRDLHA